MKKLICSCIVISLFVFITSGLVGYKIGLSVFEDFVPKYSQER